MTGTKLTPFLFEGEALVRVVTRGELPWFVAADVCRVLDIKQATRAVENLDPEEKGVSNTHTPGGDQELLVVSESGLYALIFRSRKAAAVRFRKWVTGEVLPAIRRTGSYVPGSAPKSDRASIDAMRAATGALGELRRTVGIRVAARAAPSIFGKLGVPVDLSQSSTLAQGEFDLPPDRRA